MKLPIEELIEFRMMKQRLIEGRSTDVSQEEINEFLDLGVDALSKLKDLKRRTLGGDCPHCGIRNGPGNNLCKGCGNPLDVDALRREEEKGQDKQAQKWFEKGERASQKQSAKDAAKFADTLEDPTSSRAASGGGAIGPSAETFSNYSAGEIQSLKAKVAQLEKMVQQLTGQQQYSAPTASSRTSARSSEQAPAESSQQQSDDQEYTWSERYAAEE